MTHLLILYLQYKVFASLEDEKKFAFVDGKVLNTEQVGIMQTLTLAIYVHVDHCYFQPVNSALLSGPTTDPACVISNSDLECVGTA